MRICSAGHETAPFNPAVTECLVCQAPSLPINEAIATRDAVIMELTAEVERLAVFAEGAVWGKPDAARARALLSRLGVRP